jgi:hypothetical protein
MITPDGLLHIEQAPIFEKFMSDCTCDDGVYMNALELSDDAVLSRGGQVPAQ